MVARQNPVSRRRQVLQPGNRQSYPAQEAKRPAAGSHGPPARMPRRQQNDGQPHQPTQQVKPGPCVTRVGVSADEHASGAKSSSDGERCEGQKLPCTEGRGIRQPTAPV